jgi:hypothetical protein
MIQFIMRSALLTCFLIIMLGASALARPASGIPPGITKRWRILAEKDTFNSMEQVVLRFHCNNYIECHIAVIGSGRKIIWKKQGLLREGAVEIPPMLFSPGSYKCLLIVNGRVVGRDHFRVNEAHRD